MPIRPENRHYYRGEEYEALRTAVRERAEDKCEHCKVPNGDRIFFTHTGEDPYDERAVWWNGQGWVTRSGKVLPLDLLRARCSRLIYGPDLKFGRWLDVVCGIAHLDHDPRHKDATRCAWLCARCHLLHDQKDNHARARRNHARKVGQLWLDPSIEAAAAPEAQK